MERRALIVGINTYGGGNDLHASIADAEAMAAVLGRHKDGDKNFDCVVWLDQTDDGSGITRTKLRAAITSLFANPAAMNKDSGKSPLSAVRENMTVIAASRATEGAIEAGGHGLFTGALLDALEGGAADHMEFVTAPALYAYVSRRFTAWDQRPVYKTSATDVLNVRECEPLISRLQLRQLPTYFPTADYQFRLDPEYEPEDEHGTIKEPVNKEKMAIAQRFKVYRDAGLLKSSDPALQLYWVARRNGCVELTRRGREYWWLIVNDKL